MARRSFKLPESQAPAQPSNRPPEAVALVGGDLEMRRAHGHPSELKGTYLFDPIFREEDMAALKAWCEPDPERPLVVEIGFQRARFAAQWCQQNAGARYLGFEVRKKFCEDADAWLVRHEIDNARLALVDARSVLTDLIPEGTVDAFFCFFPDPWWKKRHMKKRLVSRSFAEVAQRLLKDDGVLVVKTDVQGYADWAEQELREVAGWRVERLDDPHAGLPLTQRERRCQLRELPTWAIEARNKQEG